MSERPAAPRSPIGARIRQARKAAGFNQGELAGRLGVTQPTVANWEAGAHDPRQLMLAKLADALDVSLGWLAAGESAPTATPQPTPCVPYLRRSLAHVPVLVAADAGRLCEERLDPHLLATDFVPVTHAAGDLIAVFLGGEDGDDGAIETLYVIDRGRKTPSPGKLMVVRSQDGLAVLSGDEPDAAAVIGTVTASIRFH